MSDFGAIKRPYQRWPIKCINLNTNQAIYYKTQAEAAKELGIHITCINKVLAGIYHKTRGYAFEYAAKAEYERHTRNSNEK